MQEGLSSSLTRVSFEEAAELSDQPHQELDLGMVTVSVTVVNGKHMIVILNHAGDESAVVTLEIAA